MANRKSDSEERPAPDQAARDEARRTHGPEIGVYQGDMEPDMHAGRRRFGAEHGFEDDWKREGGSYHGMSHQGAGAVASEDDERKHALDEATQWLEDDSAQRSVYSARVDLGFDEVNPQRGRQSNDFEDDGSTPVDPRERS